MADRSSLDVERLSFMSAVHHKVESRGGILSHQLGDRGLGDEAVFICDLDLEKSSMEWIERRLVQGRRHHLTEPLEPLNLDLTLALVVPNYLVTLKVIRSPVGLLTDVYSVERWLGEIHVSGVDQWPQIAIEEGEQERRDMMTIAVRVSYKVTERLCCTYITPNAQKRILP